MKFKVGDTVKVTGGKDKGKTGVIAATQPELNSVIVTGMNMYTKHVKPVQGKAGEKVRRERPLPTAKVAILNDKGQPDRVGYQVAKDGQKVRIYKKTGTVVATAKIADKSATKSSKK